jgi:hypothetical protein
MKRRGFLGFLGGAAVAGPSMAKQAVAVGKSHNKSEKSIKTTR